MNTTAQECKALGRVARWQSRGGRYWIELHRDRYGYNYRSDNGGGSFGDMPEAFALAQVRARVLDILDFDGISLRQVEGPAVRGEGVSLS